MVEDQLLTFILAGIIAVPFTAIILDLIKWYEGPPDDKDSDF